VVLIAPARVKPYGPLPATCAVRYFPTSAVVETYDVVLAPEIAVHPVGIVVYTELTGWLHRNQKITIVGAGVPVHVPRLAVHVEPTVGEPDTVGGVVFTGTPSATVLVAPASAKPSGLFPATWAVRYLPASAVVDTYEVPFAPAIAAHPVGIEVYTEVTGWLQRNQKITIVGAGFPVQVPTFTVQVAPIAGDPDTVGGVVYPGLADGMATVFTAPDRAKPTGLLPATWAVRYLPASADVTTCEVPFAPAIAAHPAGIDVYTEVTGW
jgi:phage terminase large subunit-like protein